MLLSTAKLGFFYLVKEKNYGQARKQKIAVLTYIPFF